MSRQHQAPGELGGGGPWAVRAARWFDMVMPAGNAAHIEARVASGLGISASQEASQSPCAAQRRRPDLGCVAGPPRTT